MLKVLAFLLVLVSVPVGAQSIMYDLFVDGKKVAVITSILIHNDIVAMRSVGGLKCQVDDKE